MKLWVSQTRIFRAIKLRTSNVCKNNTCLITNFEILEDCENISFKLPSTVGQSLLFKNMK